MPGPCSPQLEKAHTKLMLKKATDETDRDIIREPLTELKHLWENLGEKIAHRQVRQMAERVTWTTVYCYLIS